MTSRSRKSRRTTARNAPATAVRETAVKPAVAQTSIFTKIDARRAWCAAGAAGVAAILLFYLSTSARGAEPTRAYRSSTGSSLKWRTAGGGWQSAGTTTPGAFPISAASEAPALAEPPAPRRDLQVVAVQAVKPIDDPFGDKSAPPAAPGATRTAPSVAPTQPTLAPAPTAPALPDAGSLAAAGSNFEQEKCPTIADLKPIGALTNRVDAAPGELPKECYFDERTESPTNRNWVCTTFTWKASGMCHKPLYFEQEAVERYGHSTGKYSQPFVNAAHFFLTVPILPYKMGIEAPWECKYALGYYRPNSCAPYIIPPFPISARGAVLEAGTAAGLVFILP